MRFAERQSGPSSWHAPAVWMAVITSFNLGMLLIYELAFSTSRFSTPELALLIVAVPLPIVLIVAAKERRTRKARQIRGEKYLRCPKCNYLLVDLPESGKCPECGEVYSPEVLHIAWAIKLGLDTLDTPSTPSPPTPHTPHASPTPPPGASTN